MLELNNFIEDQHLRASPTYYSYLTPTLSLSPLPITTFIFLAMVVAADYQDPITKDKVEG